MTSFIFGVLVTDNSCCFCAKIVVDFGFESVIIDCLYSGTFLIEQLKKYDIFDIKINNLLDVLTQFREASLINFTKYRSK